MSKDFEELFACLRHRNVKALIVGGYAVAFHGQPRFTKDRVAGRASGRPQDLLDIDSLS
jgi:hypothetical protein